MDYGQMLKSVVLNLTYFVEQPRTENDLDEIVDDKSILKLEWFSVLHKPWAEDLKKE